MATERDRRNTNRVAAAATTVAAHAERTLTGAVAAHAEEPLPGLAAAEVSTAAVLTLAAKGRGLLSNVGDIREKKNKEKLRR